MSSLLLNMTNVETLLHRKQNGSEVVARSGTNISAYPTTFGDVSTVWRSDNSAPTVVDIFICAFASETLSDVEFVYDTHWGPASIGKLNGGSDIVLAAATKAIGTVNTNTNTFTSTAHGLQTGDLIRFTAAALPTGLTADTDYYAVRVDADDFQVTLTAPLPNQTAPAAVSVSSTGTTVVAHRPTRCFLQRVDVPGIARGIGAFATQAGSASVRVSAFSAYEVQ